MGAQLRAVRSRIRAVKSIAKITRAQELIAASRIVKAQQRMRAAEPYSRELTQAVEAVVSRSSTLNHPMITEPESLTRAAVLILTSDGGFCGAYNANVLREAARLRARATETGSPATPTSPAARASHGTASATSRWKTAGAASRRRRATRRPRRSPLALLDALRSQPARAAWTRSTSSPPSSSRC